MPIRKYQHAGITASSARRKNLCAYKITGFIFNFIISCYNTYAKGELNDYCNLSGQF